MGSHDRTKIRTVFFLNFTQGFLFLCFCRGSSHWFDLGGVIWIKVMPHTSMKKTNQTLMKAPGLVAFSQTTVFKSAHVPFKPTAMPWPLTDYLKVILNSEILNYSRRFYNCPLNIEC